MKKLYSISIIAFITLLINTLSTYAQAPEGFTYQAEVRDSRGRILANTSIIVNAQILQGSAQSNVDVWDETFNVKLINTGYLVLSLAIQTG